MKEFAGHMRELVIVAHENIIPSTLSTEKALEQREQLKFLFALFLASPMHGLAPQLVTGYHQVNEIHDKFVVLDKCSLGQELDFSKIGDNNVKFAHNCILEDAVTQAEHKIRDTFKSHNVECTESKGGLLAIFKQVIRLETQWENRPQKLLLVLPTDRECV